MIRFHRHFPVNMNPMVHLVGRHPFQHHIQSFPQSYPINHLNLKITLKINIYPRVNRHSQQRQSLTFENNIVCFSFLLYD